MPPTVDDFTTPMPLAIHGAIGPEPPAPTDADSPFRLIKGTSKPPATKASGVRPDLDGVVTLLEAPVTRKVLLESGGSLEFDDKRLVITLDREPVDIEQLACRFRINAQRQLTTITRRGDVVPLRFRHDAATQGIIYSAKQNPFSSVREFLEGLRAKPVTPGAIAAVAREGLHLSSELDVELLRNFAIGAVARAMKPGCKVDCVLVLQGPQGFQKSGAFQALAGPDNFVDTVMDIDRKDAFLQLHAAWLYEWSELDALKGKELTRVKSFITSQVDTFRAPYDRAAIPHPRTTVLCGTTNSDQFLFDATGNRRFCPTRITKRINLVAIRALREAFWREAVSHFDNGIPWWFDDDSKLQ